MNKNISDAMISFWKNKTSFEKQTINEKRSESNSACIYIKKDAMSRAQACNFNNLIEYLIKDYKICKTPKNLYKLKDLSIPEEFFI